MEQDKQWSDQFRNTRLLQWCFDLWRQDRNWVIVSLMLGLGPAPHNFAKFKPYLLRLT